MLATLARLVPRDAGYHHVEGNSDAHIKTTIVGNHVRPGPGGPLRLGTWQHVYLAEFDGPRTRRVWLEVTRSALTAWMEADVARPRLLVLIGGVSLAVAGVLIVVALSRSPSGTGAQVASTESPSPTTTTAATAGPASSGGPAGPNDGPDTAPATSITAPASGATTTGAIPGRGRTTGSTFATSPVLSLPTAQLRRTLRPPRQRPRPRPVSRSSA